jgi:hypothetical protein
LLLINNIIDLFINKIDSFIKVIEQNNSKRTGQLNFKITNIATKMSEINFPLPEDRNLFINYMKFYTTKKETVYCCFTEEHGGCIPPDAINLMENNPSIDDAYNACYILDKAIQTSLEDVTQLDYFMFGFLPFFEGLSDEFYDSREADEVFLASGKETISYFDVQFSYMTAENKHVLKFATEMCVDLWSGNFSEKDPVLKTPMANIGNDIVNIINKSEYSQEFKRDIFEASCIFDDKLVETLVNIVIKAYKIAKSTRVIDFILKDCHGEKNTREGSETSFEELTQKNTYFRNITNADNAEQEVEDCGW